MKMGNGSINDSELLKRAFRAMVVYFAFESADEMMAECFYRQSAPCVCVKCLDYFDELSPDTDYGLCPECGSKAVMSAQVIENRLR